MGRLIPEARYSHEEADLHLARSTRAYHGIYSSGSPRTLEDIDDWKGAAQRAIEIDPDGSISRALLRKMDRK
jgi:hypothetical protein